MLLPKSSNIPRTGSYTLAWTSSTLSEMEQAMNFATQELAALQPGLDRAHEK
ncbi:hypothetical protein JVT61DRAFT_3170 [Boletus reticuloceps]|uniref:Uncharacterized protein n=1 Tax=Boletus reticuloceps TaxID=495285 RepID=A0A8I2YMY5_9AGAM|nr:hypothetical protein JVT61DRAFT_3170 [Boletus reticuloceps]